MELIFFRHGDAEDVGPDGSDFGRRLTARGKAESEAMAEFLLGAGNSPDAIVSSPLTRAQETAEVLARSFGHEGGAETDDRLKSGARLEGVAGIVADHPAERLLLVGHEPDFSRMVSDLIGGGRIEMKKSGAACVSVRGIQRGAGELQWLIRPDILRAP